MKPTIMVGMNDTDESVKSIGSNKRCSPGGDVDVARLGVVGSRGLWKNSVYFFAQFCCEPKIAPKK